MKPGCFFCLLLSLAGSSHASAATRSKSPPAVQNAAVKYLRADITLRDSQALPPDAPTALIKALDSPLDESDEKLVAASGEALTEFEHGAELKQCDWELSAQDGPSADTSHREAVRELVLVAALRARIRFRDNHQEDAIKDSLAAITASRQLSHDGTIASLLISYSLESRVSQILAHNLSHLSPTELRQLAGRLSAAPRQPSMAEALRSEELDRHPLATVVHGAASRDDLIARLVNGVAVLDGDNNLARQLVDECGGSVQGFSHCIQQQQAFCKSWLARFSLPPEEFERDYKLQLSSQADPNPLITRYTPSLPSLRWAEAYHQTRLTLLRAAIAVQLEGPAALVHFNDPYRDDLFAYIPLDHGFRLESELTDNNGPLSLSTQPDPVP